MKYKLLLNILLLTAIGTTALAQNADPATWTNKQVKQWFSKADLFSKTLLKPDTSINKREFAVRYYKHKDLWDKAFAFLRDSDLASLTLGVHELQGKDLFVKVTQYQTKEPEYAPFESHTKYSDIHTVVSGIEYIEVSAPAVSAVKVPYDEAKDTQLYTVSASHRLLARPGTVFLLFPDNLHKQGVRTGISTLVRKIVIKVKN
jgi:biofilm protein TabA